MDGHAVAVAILIAALNIVAIPPPGLVSTIANCLDETLNVLPLRKYVYY